MRLLRKVHAWLGFYAALTLIFFAITGFLLNHRAILKIPALEKNESVVVMALPTPFERPDELAAWAAAELDMPLPRIRLTQQGARQIPWRDGELQLPERWSIRADLPERYAEIEYWRGERRVEIKLRQPNLGMTLARYHMGIGLAAPWVLFADSAALALALMGVSGLCLWTRLHGSARLGWGLVSLGLAGALFGALFRL